LTHERFFDASARDRHRGGWTGSMERLERYLAKEPSATTGASI
jgi:hypothetical protein